MALMHNHYEAAFAAYLREQHVPTVAVNEQRRSSLWNGVPLKSLDFIINGHWLVDIKGRLFPSGRTQRQYWKNWVTRSDLIGMRRWEEIFGSPFQGLLVFAYGITGNRTPLEPERLYRFRGNYYAFLAISLMTYAGSSRILSPRWDTVSMPARTFRRLAIPVDELLGLWPRKTESLREIEARKNPLKI